MSVVPYAALWCALNLQASLSPNGGLGYMNMSSSLSARLCRTCGCHASPASTRFLFFPHALLLSYASAFPCECHRAVSKSRPLQLAFGCLVAVCLRITATILTAGLRSAKLHFSVQALYGRGGARSGSPQQDHVKSKLFDCTCIC